MYINRDIENIIRELENDYPILTIIGPRQSGKTSLVRYLYSDYNYVNLEEAASYQLALDSPDEFFKFYTPPLIIDEIQRAPELLRKIQLLSDESNQRAKQFILTGSQEIHIKGYITQSQAGRSALFNVLPLSLNEMIRSGNFKVDRDLILLKGCYPKLFGQEISSSFHYYQNYISTYIQKDVKQIISIQDERLFYLFLQLLAGRVGQLLNFSTLANDLGVARHTINRWISVLEASHIIHLLYPWGPSRTNSLVKTPKLYFCDTGVVSALLNITTANQMLRDPLRGSIFENFCVMEAVKQRNNKAMPTNLYFYRDKYKTEVDLLFESGRKLFPFEIKSSDRYNKEHLSKMKKFRLQNKKYLAEGNNGALIYAGDIKTELDGYQIIPFTEIGKVFQ